VRRSRDGVFVNIFVIRGVEIFGKGRGYDFGSEALRDDNRHKDGHSFLKTQEAYKDLKNILAPWTTRCKDDALPCKFVDSWNVKCMGKDGGGWGFRRHRLWFTSTCDRHYCKRSSVGLGIVIKFENQISAQL
jgi:hypothetical protein